MIYRYRCRDSGNDCSFEYSADTKKAVISRIKIHNRYAHGIFEMDDEQIKKVENLIKEES